MHFYSQLTRNLGDVNDARADSWFITEGELFKQLALKTVLGSFKFKEYVHVNYCLCIAMNMLSVIILCIVLFMHVFAVDTLFLTGILFSRRDFQDTLFHAGFTLSIVNNTVNLA